MDYRVAETIYNPAVRLEDGTPEIIAYVGDLWTDEMFRKCQKVGVIEIEMTYMGYPFTCYLED